MNGVPVSDGSFLDGHLAEWRRLSEEPCNALLEGTVAATDAVLHLLQPGIREPIVWHRSPATLQLPSGEAPTFILREAAALSRDEQRRLLAWTGEAGSRTHIITTASTPLFALVEAGVFDAALYYRLNVLLLRVTSPFQRGLPCGAEGSPRADSPITISTSSLV
jgi:hypothetical protein